MRKLLFIFSCIFPLILSACQLQNPNINITNDIKELKENTVLTGIDIENQELIIPTNNDKLLAELGLSTTHCIMESGFIYPNSLSKIQDKENHGQFTPCYINGELYILYIQPSTMIDTYKDYDFNDKSQRFFTWGDTVIVNGKLYQGTVNIEFQEESTLNTIKKVDYPCNYLIATRIICQKSDN